MSNVAAMLAVGCGVALYVGLLGSMVTLAIKAQHDPDVRFGACCMVLLLLGFLFAGVAVAAR